MCILQHYTIIRPQPRAYKKSRDIARLFSDLRFTQLVAQLLIRLSVVDRNPQAFS